MGNIMEGMLRENSTNDPVPGTPVLDMSLVCWEANVGQGSERVYELIYHYLVA
jgi:hypothetical protein